MNGGPWFVPPIRYRPDIDISGDASGVFLSTDGTATPAPGSRKDYVLKSSPAESRPISKQTATMNIRSELPLVLVPADVRQIEGAPWQAVVEGYLTALTHGSGAAP